MQFLGVFLNILFYLCNSILPEKGSSLRRTKQAGICFTRGQFWESDTKRACYL